MKNNSASAAMGDSDDESENSESRPEVLSKVSENVEWRVERLVSDMQSASVEVRLKALRALKVAVAALSKEKGQTASPLSFPVPYDITRITLTHKQYGAIVSDMAKGTNVAEWKQWERTHAPLSSQFPDCDNEEIERSHPEKKNEAIATEPVCHGNNTSNSLARSSLLDANVRLQALFDSCGTALFRLFSDVCEPCRELAIGCVQQLCLAAVDIGRHIAYLLTAVLSRYPSAVFDGEMQVFVHNLVDHDFYRRGGATQRQDRSNLLTTVSNFQPLEPSEEVRLSLCELFSSILRCTVHCKGTSHLDAYFADIIMALQTHLMDPFPLLKARAANLLVHFIRVPRWELQAMCFATALSRAAIPNMRHRQSLVRYSAIELFEASVSLPNREKIKGAGSDAIIDLVGFSEENVLPIAAFYKSECSVTVNTLAELVLDENSRVRARCCKMLSFFMICLPDRYDHHQRLLPYLLSFFNDYNRETSQCAMEAVEECGKQYEAEHPDEIIERRQYGVDGDSRCNHTLQLLPPFYKRPRLGARLFVRGNVKRFFSALLSELSNWRQNTREQSAKLLQILVIYCEEHLTMDFHNTLPIITRAIQQVNLDEKEVKRSSSPTSPWEVLHLMGRFVDPDVYIPILATRIVSNDFAREDAHSDAFIAANASALGALLGGSLAVRLLPHSATLLNVLLSDNVIGQFSGPEVKLECVKSVVVVLEALQKASLVLRQYEIAGGVEIWQTEISLWRESLCRVMQGSERQELVTLAQRGLNVMTSMVSLIV